MIIIQFVCLVKTTHIKERRTQTKFTKLIYFTQIVNNLMKYLPTESDITNYNCRTRIQCMLCFHGWAGFPNIPGKLKMSSYYIKISGMNIFKSNTRIKYNKDIMKFQRYTNQGFHEIVDSLAQQFRVLGQNYFLYEVSN